MADKDQTDEPLKDEILPPEDTAPLGTQETVQTEETVEGELSPMGEIITEITDLLAALPGDCAEIKQGIEECLIDVHLEFEDVVSRESIARRQIATLKRSLRQEKEQAKLLRHKIFVGGSDNNYQDIEDGTLDLPDDDIDEEEETPKARKGKQKRKMPKDIKTIEIKHYPEQTHCPCGGELKEIGHWILSSGSSRSITCGKSTSTSAAPATAAPPARSTSPCPHMPRASSAGGARSRRGPWWRRSARNFTNTRRITASGVAWTTPGSTWRARRLAATRPTSRAFWSRCATNSGGT
ncbi:hypothetical protein U717_07930 [Rhodobacter capsulatus R121]|jgi:hypothetical protein|nr:hypothetical protein U714_07755 [Rhodobacter capsulatus DE442]ETD77866.1 hypothetical protein U717_07930 [Rhodobacter capsulatus R121]ETE54209.1 hypothetical protein U715_07930 [Rhodobacter capsulatus Y262]